MFELPQYGQRSGGLTGDDGGGLTERLDMRIFVARWIQKVMDLQERRQGCGRGFAKIRVGAGRPRICKAGGGKREEWLRFRRVGG
jgi:hypothetical protein